MPKTAGAYTCINPAEEIRNLQAYISPRFWRDFSPYYRTEFSPRSRRDFLLHYLQRDSLCVFEEIFCFSVQIYKEVKRWRKLN